MRSDLAYAASRAGLACYSKVLGKSLSSEQDSHVRLLGVRVGHLRMPVGTALADGIRITARVGISGSPVTVRLYVDALSLPYGPAELDLYSTSFVQPVAERTAAGSAGAAARPGAAAPAVELLQIAWWLRSTSCTTVSRGTVSWLPASMSRSAVSCSPTTAT